MVKIKFEAMTLCCPLCKIPLSAGVDEKVPNFVLLFCAKCKTAGINLYLNPEKPLEMCDQDAQPHEFLMQELK